MKSVVIIMVSALLMMPILFTVSSCEENALQTRVTDGGGGGTDDSKPIMLTRRSECTSSSDDKCEGTQCDNNTSYCRYATVENEDGDTCSEVCRDLFSKDARDECLEYKPDIIFDVKELVDLLVRPTTEKLEDEVDKQSLCILLKIDPEPWVEEIEDYRSSRAETVFKWVVDENVSSYFVEDDHQKDFMEQLLSALGGEDRVTSYNIFEGFNTNVNVDDDDDEQLPALFYLSENDGSRNSEVFQFVHELILVDEVCKESNRPTANIAGITDVDRCGNDGDEPCYGKHTDTSSTARGRVTQKEAEDEFDLQACILGVYCHIADEHDDTDDLRENAAHILNDREVVEFIEVPIDEGGLELDDDDAEDWTDTACDTLDLYWNNNKASGASGELDLDLGRPDLD